MWCSFFLCSRPYFQPSKCQIWIILPLVLRPSCHGLVSRPQPPRLLVDTSPFWFPASAIHGTVPCHHRPWNLGQHIPRAQNKCRLLSLALWTPWNGLHLMPLLWPSCLTALSASFPPAILNHVTYPKHTLYFSILLCSRWTLSPISTFCYCLLRASQGPSWLQLLQVIWNQQFALAERWALSDLLLFMMKWWVHWLIISS